jgi:predicted short-subunit dehydrogenase-like oxidoreductase (DUF2520 family)
MEHGHARLDVGVISAGRAGSVLGAALAAAGHRVVAVSAVSEASRARAEALLPQAQILPPPDVAARANLLLLAVPDDVLAELVAGLANTGAIAPGTFVAHTSGRYGVDVLTPATQSGALPLALHPAMTFTGTSLDLGRLTGACFGVTAPEALRPVAEALVVEMGAEPQWVAEEARVLYHAALAHGANHLVTVVAQALDALRAAGVAEPERLLRPLVTAAADNTLRVGDAALTGPVARGDARTVRAHVETLSAHDAGTAATYLALARATADRALADRRLRPSDAEDLLDALGTVEIGEELQ